MCVAGVREGAVDPVTNSVYDKMPLIAFREIMSLRTMRPYPCSSNTISFEGPEDFQKGQHNEPETERP